MKKPARRATAAVRRAACLAGIVALSCFGAASAAVADEPSAVVFTLPAFPAAQEPMSLRPPVRVQAALRQSDPVQSTPLPAGESNVEVIPPPAPNDGLATLFPNLETTPIDLASALALVDVRNPQYMLAQQRVLEAMGLRQLAASQFLPTLNAGANYDDHTGNLQQSSGNMLSVDRNSFFVGAGANALAASTTNIPGVIWTQNLADVTYGYLASRQAVRARSAGSAAARNEIGLQVVSAYLDLLQAEGERAIALRVRREAIELSTLTANHAKTGQGRQSDANRAATELVDRDANVLAAEGEMLKASARLARLLGLDPSLRLHPTDNWVVPHPIVPDPIPLEELLIIALTQRPELQEQQALVRQAMLQLEGARMLPFSPTVFLGYSSGSFGGGSNLVNAPPGSNPFALGNPSYGLFSTRTDFDAIAFWTLKNVGFGNRALIDAVRARLSSNDWQRVYVYEQIRMEVANSHARTRARLAQIELSEEAVQAATNSWVEDMNRIRALEGLPIEAMDSLRLLAKARTTYLKSIVEYNRSQFALYVALGQPPADVLVRPADVPPQPPAQPNPQP